MLSAAIVPRTSSWNGHKAGLGAQGVLSANSPKAAEPPCHRCLACAWPRAENAGWRFAVARAPRRNGPCGRTAVAGLARAPREGRRARVGSQVAPHRRAIAAASGKAQNCLFGKWCSSTLAESGRMTCPLATPWRSRPGTPRRPSSGPTSAGSLSSALGGFGRTTPRANRLRSTPFVPGERRCRFRAPPARPAAPRQPARCHRRPALPHAPGSAFSRATFAYLCVETRAVGRLLGTEIKRSTNPRREEPESSDVLAFGTEGAIPGPDDHPDAWRGRTGGEPAAGGIPREPRGQGRRELPRPLRGGRCARALVPLQREALQSPAPRAHRALLSAFWSPLPGAPRCSGATAVSSADKAGWQ